MVSSDLSLNVALIEESGEKPLPSTPPRRPWLAALLGLFFGPLGWIYVGRLRRAICFLLAGECLCMVLALCVVRLSVGRVVLAIVYLAIVAIPFCLAVDAFVLARRSRHMVLKRYQRWWAYVLFVVAFSIVGQSCAFFMRSFLCEAFIMPTRGMIPTLQPGDRFLVDRLPYGRSAIHRNDIVAFRSEGPGSPIFAQRVVGLPGDEVEIRNERVFINGQPFDDSHAVFKGEAPSVPQLLNHGPKKVPDDSYFFLGDNRRLSRDSRLIGPIPASDIHGIARIIYWSRERLFPHPNNIEHFTPGRIRWERLGQPLTPP
jgi:signal peptidase I